MMTDESEHNSRNPTLKRDLVDAKQTGKAAHGNLKQIEKAMTNFHQAVKEEAKKQGHWNDDETASAPGTPVKSKPPTPGKK